MAAETNMREVVDRLRAEGSEALLELLEFDSAIEAFLQELQRIAPTFRDLHLVASKVVDLRNGEPLAWIAVREQTKHPARGSTNFWSHFANCGAPFTAGISRVRSRATANGQSRRTEEGRNNGHARDYSIGSTRASLIDSDAAQHAPTPPTQPTLNMKHGDNPRILVGTMLEELATDAQAVLVMANVFEQKSTGTGLGAEPQRLTEMAALVKSAALALVMAAANLVGATERLKIVAAFAEDEGMGGGSMPS
jgi:hypothetical protein